MSEGTAGEGAAGATGEGAAGATGAEGAAGAGSAAPEGISIPTDWAGEASLFKSYWKEEGGKKTFDFDSLTRDVTNYHSISKAVPKTAEEYQTAYPKDWVLGSEDIAAVKKAAKEAGLSQAQIEAWVKHDLSRMSRATEQAAADIAKAKATLESEWKGDYQKNMTLVGMVAHRFFGDAFVKDVELGNHPAVARGLYQIAKLMGEDSFKSGGAVNKGNRPLGEDGRPILSFPSMQK